jgi:signal peptidase I
MSTVAKRKSSRLLILETQVTTFAKEFLLAAVSVLLLNSFVMAAFEVPSASMEDTVKTGDRLMVNKFVYGGSTPYTIPLTSIRIPHFRVPAIRSVKRGDVIVFDWPGNRDDFEKPTQTWYLKRCIALPHDMVKIENRTVYVNGKIFPNAPRSKFLRASSLSREARNSEIFPRDASFNEDFYGPILVPYKGMKLTLISDNFIQWEVFIRREGHETRSIGGEIYIDGHKTGEYLVQRDYVFAMGDNRDNSLDSRFWGFVPIDDVVGTPIMVLWSWDPTIPYSHMIDKIRSIDPWRTGTIIR